MNEQFLFSVAIKDEFEINFHTKMSYNFFSMEWTRPINSCMILNNVPPH